LAKRLRKRGGEPGYPSKSRAKYTALHHEIMAKMIEGRLAGRPTYYWNAPSLIPVDPA
jgi:hypothetical protein